MKYSLLVKIATALAIALIFASCSNQNNTDGYAVMEKTVYFYGYIPSAQVISAIDEIGEQEQLNTVLNAAFADELFIHWDDGITQIGSMTEGNARILYSIEDGGSRITQLAVFPSLDAEWGNAETQWSRPQSIFTLSVVDDWIILSAGEIQGSMQNFFGDLHRVRRDGSGREAFNIDSMNPRFIIIDGWIYHHIWCAVEVYGWIRIRPDGTDREYVGDFIHTIILFGDDGYIYGTNAVSGEGNLARWWPESGESVTLFLEADAPTFNEFSSRVSYQDIVVADGYVYFTVFVYGVWDYTQLICWRTPWESLYTADFRVDKDGGNLTLLQKGPI